MLHSVLVLMVPMFASRILIDPLEMSEHERAHALGIEWYGMMDHMSDDDNIGMMKPRANRSLKTNSAMTEQTVLTRNVLKCTRTDKKFTKLF